MNYIPKKEFLNQFASIIETKNKYVFSKLNSILPFIDDIKINKVTFIEIIDKCFDTNEKINFSIQEIFEYFPITLYRSYSLTTSSLSNTIENKENNSFNQLNSSKLEIIYSNVNEGRRCS